MQINVSIKKDHLVNQLFKLNTKIKRKIQIYSVLYIYVNSNTQSSLSSFTQFKVSHTRFIYYFKYKNCLRFKLSTSEYFIFPETRTKQLRKTRRSGDRQYLYTTQYSFLFQKKIISFFFSN